MDEGHGQPPRQRGPRGDGPAHRSSPPPNGQPAGGLLRRFGAGTPPDAGRAGGPPPARRAGGPAQAPVASQPRPNGAPGRTSGREGDERRQGTAPPGGGGLLSRFSRMEGAANQAWTAFTGQVRRTAEEVLHPDRRPAEGDWRASDYDPRDLDAMIDTLDEERRDSRAAPARRGANRRDAGAATPWAGARPRDSRGTRGWDDEAEWERDWDAGWETGTWDAGWTQDGDGAGGGWDDEDDEWNALGDHRDADWAHSLVAVGAASMAELPVGRLARFRMLRRERPAAAAMLLVFMLGFVLTCVAPLVPLAR
ncbi:MAG TPA: hypothetical protein VGN32_06015, partial [Ktedonobacterales bacterium]|nr:hypothetical protein [Ktedonobacterales bacterium]